MNGRDRDPANSDLSHAYRIDLVCDDFEQALHQGAAPRIEKFLDGVDNPKKKQLLLELLAIELEFRAGESPPPTVEAWSERFPDQTDAVAEAFDLHQRIAETTAPQHDTLLGRFTGETIASSQPGALTPGSVFGDFRILRQLGIGGMGVVFLAEQRSIKRLVALKVIRREPVESLDPEHHSAAVDRFHNEAQAAAQLDHPGIITVYEVGKIEGRDYLAMRYVEGKSLSQLLQTGPMENRRAAQYMAEVSDAVHTAHTLGVLHRDLKPQNILIERETDRALVADFGLAKLATGESALTQCGDLMGTPQYMPPEQARDAGTVTSQADVYAIGATLYHLLTGRPPFQAATALETVQQLLRDDPILPRQLNRGIDRDLETICLKCLHKELDHRFATALEVGEDLRRYLEHLPILARPIGIGGRAQRWCRRNPRLAVVSTAAVGAILCALAAATVGFVTTSAAQRDSEAGFREARQALGKIVNHVSDEPGWDDPALDDLKRDILEQALSYYQEFLASRARDTSIQDEVAATYYLVGTINQKIGAVDAALESMLRARDIQTRLVDAHPDDAERLALLGSIVNATGRVYASRELWDAAQQLFEEAVAIRNRLADLDDVTVASRRDYQRMLLNSQMNLGIVATRQGQFEQALQRYQLAQEMRRSMLVQDPNDSPLRRDLGLGYFNLGQLALSSDQHDAAIEHLASAVTELHLVAERPDGTASEETRYSLASSLRLLGDLEPDYDRAKSHYLRAAETLRPVVMQNPQARHLAEELAQSLMNLGQLEQEAQQNEAAMQAFAEAKTFLTRLAEYDGSLPTVQRNLGVLWHAIGEIQLARGDQSLASDSLGHAMTWLERLTSGTPPQDDLDLLARTHNLLKSIRSDGP